MFPFLSLPDSLLGQAYQRWQQSCAIHVFKYPQMPVCCVDQEPPSLTGALFGVLVTLAFPLDRHEPFRLCILPCMAPGLSPPTVHLILAFYVGSDSGSWA
jgi:hypothetical protein